MMRQYSAFAPTFWTGDTGRAIKRHGHPHMLLAAYLFTGPSATMYGLYYLPFPTLCHEAGFSPDEARAILADLADLGFAYYDGDAQLMWVPTMPRWQIGPELHPRDKRVRGIETYLRPFLAHPYARDFIKRYGRAYSLSIKAVAKPLGRAFQAPSKPGTGTETETGTGAGNRERLTPPTPRKRGASTVDPAAGEEANGNGHRPGPRDELRDAALKLRHQVEQARVFAVDQKLEPTRADCRVFRSWFRGGATLAVVQTRIERGDHLARRTPDGGVYRPEVRPPDHLGDEELELLDLPAESAQPPPGHDE
jgi:hypothetical protein